MAETINRRAEKMWSYIRPAIAKYTTMPGMKESDPLFAGWRFVDLGSGYGDFTVRLLGDGAASVLAVDNNHDNLRVVRERVSDMGMRASSRCRLVYGDLNSKAFHVGLFDPPGHTGFHKPEIAICTSVLPYLKFPGDLLYMMAETCGLSIIECQYANDGPGFSWIKDDTDMKRFLLNYFPVVRAIGATELDIRAATRTIWACAGVVK